MNSLIQDYRDLLKLTQQWIEQERHVNTIDYQTVSLHSSHCSTKQETSDDIKPLTKEPILPASSLLTRALDDHPVEKTTAPPPAPANFTETDHTQPVKKETAERHAGRFSMTLEPLVPGNKSIWIEMSSFLQREFPGLKIVEEIPDDSIARNVRTFWKDAMSAADVVLLSFQEPSNQTELLNEIANAITILHKPAKVLPALKIEQEKGWGKLLSSSNLKLFIASDYAIYGLPELMKHYRESSKTAEHFLGKVPLFLLADLSLYLREPLLKPSLWKALSATIART